jgi:hypothetical protein
MFSTPDGLVPWEATQLAHPLIRPWCPHLWLISVMSLLNVFLFHIPAIVLTPCTYLWYKYFSFLFYFFLPPTFISIQMCSMLLILVMCVRYYSVTHYHYVWNKFLSFHIADLHFPDFQSMLQLTNQFISLPVICRAFFLAEFRYFFLLIGMFW